MRTYLACGLILLAAGLVLEARAADQVVPPATTHVEPSGLDASLQQRLLLERLLHEVSCLRYEVRAERDRSFAVPPQCDLNPSP